LKLKELSSHGRQFDGIYRFKRNLDIIEKEMLDLDMVLDLLQTKVTDFYQMLD